MYTIRHSIFKQFETCYNLISFDAIDNLIRLRKHRNREEGAFNMETTSRNKVNK